MRFDYFSATLLDSPEAVIRALSKAIDMVSVSSTGGGRTYREGVKVHRGERVFSRVFWDNVSDPGHVLIEAKGYESPDVERRIRTSFPQYRITRADISEDYNEPGAFDQLSSCVLGIADQFGLKVNYVGDWHRGVDGRTIYIGSRSSTQQVCLYEKGKQLKLDPDWVRLELRVRPKGDKGFLLSGLLPSQFYGVAKWCRALGAALSISGLVPVSIGTAYRQSDLDRALDHMVKQYARPLRYVLRKHDGDLAQAMAYLIDRREELATAERQRLRSIRRPSSSAPVANHK